MHTLNDIIIRMKVKNNAEQGRKYPSLSSIFEEQMELGWQILQYESGLYSEMSTTLDSITTLTALYMRIIEKLNSLQDPREQYFTLKMQKLMAEPYVIRCFNNTQENKKSSLQSRRKELQQKIEKEVQRQNHRKIVKQAIEAQEEKQKRIQGKVQEIIIASQRKLEQRIKQRNKMRQMRNSIISTSLIGSDDSFTLTSPRFASNRRFDRAHSLVPSNSEFQLSMDQINEIKREIQQQQIEQRFQHKLGRDNQPNILHRL